MDGARLSPRSIDVLLAVGVTAVLAFIVASAQGGTFDQPVNPVAYLWTIGLGMLMLIRRSHPLLVLFLTAVGFLSYYAAGFPAMGVAMPIAAALFSAAEMGHSRAAVVTGVVALTLATTYRVAARQNLAFVLGYELPGHAALIAAVIALGHNLRTTRQLRLRRDQVNRLLTRQRALDDQVTQRDDRINLARDLHDSIGHSLAVASLYADLAREHGGDAVRRDEYMTMVKASVSEALSHLRRTVRLLRHGRGQDSVPGLRDVEQLGHAPRAAGYEVQMDVETIDVPPAVGAAIYRLVQEGITNTLKHSSGRRIEVDVRSVGPRVVDVTVSDDGCHASADTVTLGHGLSGMRERVADLGGELTVSSEHDGWRVHATIPLEAGR